MPEDARPNVSDGSDSGNGDVGQFLEGFYGAGDDGGQPTEGDGGGEPEAPQPEPGPGDAEPSEPAAEGGETATDEGQDPAPATDGQEPVPDAGETQVPAALPELIEWNGKQYTKESFMELAETWRNQNSHFQELHRNTSEELKTLKEQMAALNAPKPETAKWDPALAKADAERTVAHFKPQLDQMAEAGVIEQEMVDDYPKFASRYARDRHEVTRAVGGMYQMIKKLNDWYDTVEEQMNIHESTSKLDGFLSELGKERTALTDPSHRAEFKKFLTEFPALQKVEIDDFVNDPVTTKAFYDMWIKNQKPPVPTTAAAAVAPQAPNMAAADVSGGSAAPKPKMSPQEQEMQDFLKNYAAAQGFAP